MAWDILKTVLKNTRISVQPVNIGLNPPGNSKFHFREIWSSQRWQRISADAARLSLNIRQPEKYVSDLTAARAIAAYGALNAEDYITSVFRAFFSSGVDISIAASLRPFLQSEGLDSTILMSAIDNPDTEKAFNEQVLLWGHERIRILPTIECGDERFCGLIDKPGLERLLRSIIE